MLNELYLEYSVVIVPMVIALMQFVKRVDLFPNRYLPLVSVLFGIILGLIAHQAHPYPNALLLGLMYGLSASGLYRSQKVIRGKD